MWIMVVVGEFGKRKCVMNVYVEEWRFWMNYDFGGIFACFANILYNGMEYFRVALEWFWLVNECGNVDISLDLWS